MIGEHCGGGSTVNLKDFRNFDMYEAFYAKDW